MPDDKSEAFPQQQDTAPPPLATAEKSAVAVGTHFYRQRYLYAFATQAEVDQYIRTQAIPDESGRVQEVLARWAALQPRVHALVQAEAGLADTIEVREGVNGDGDISNYYPDFLVKLSAKRIFIVETKGQEDLDVPRKMQRLRQWCEDINRVQPDVKYDYVYVDEESFEKYKPASFRQLVDGFREYKEKI